VVQGRVHDENAYVSGGIQGHAGLFQSGVDTATLMHRLLFANTYSPNTYHVNQTTVNLFTTPPYPDRSSRALVWDTNDDAPKGYARTIMSSNLSVIHSICLLLLICIVHVVHYQPRHLCIQVSQEH
jgi:hypothetical protein